MNDTQDNELDDLFRKSLTNPDIPFDPDAWKAMESKLDAEDRRRTPYFWISAGVVAGIFLLAGSIFFVNQKDTQPVTHTDGGQGVMAEQLSIASADNTSADQPDFSVHTKTNNDIDNIDNIGKDDTKNSTNGNGISQKTSQERGASYSKESHTNAPNFKTAKATSQASVKAGIDTKNKIVKTDNGQSAKYNTGQKSIVASEQQLQQHNNTDDTGTHTDIRKPVYANERTDTNGTQQTGTINQKYLADNKKNDGTNTADKNNVAEKNNITGAIAADAATENADVASNNKNAKKSTDVNSATDFATMTTTTTTTTTTTNNNNNNNNNNKEPDADNAQTSALGDTTQQQQTYSNLNSSNGQNALAGEYAAAKTPDTLVVAVVDPIPDQKDSLTQADTSSVKENIKKEPYKRGFSMSLILNPEYNSSVDFNFYKPNLNIGLNVEYYILPRLSLVSGIIYGKKLYTCAASDYASSPSYVYYGKTYYPKSVNASCGVLDIPINIRYKFLNKKTFNVYASTGLSSYIMLKETYIFQYSSKYRRPDEYEIHNKNRYLFNIWNISVGIEKRINDKWSVQAEPYVKIPLNGVGAGDIKLVSTGIYFSLKYYFK